MNFFKSLPKTHFRRSRLASSCLVFCGLLSVGAWAADASDKALENKLFSNGSADNIEDLGSDKNIDKASENSTLPSESAELPEISDRSEKKSEKEIKDLDEAIKGPKQIPFEHILVVQNRYVRKEGAHEITPLMLGVQPGDSFRRQFQWGFSYTYHFSEDFGIEALHVAFITNSKTGLSDTIRSNTTLETYRLEPVMVIGSTLQWTPLHSKAATDDSIYHFEGYFLAGGGMTKLETTSAGLAMGGVGFRSYLTKRAILKAEVRDYIDFINGTQQRLNVLVGASILLGGGS